ncbi:DNA polymerase III subunit alpha [Syntrophothermus lipocalidus]|uniref:DNA polymerase III subunit alpha n=1 Tax=Syntrophothermus lipocalidus TaxID=86170 RepID=UPI0002F2A6CD|nr:DNA polymerase III subunit alpha [Syntrophothermus lipocalidus]
MFVHLHVHSCFSFLDGGSSIKSLVDRAAESGMPALALTDHDNLCGAVQFKLEAQKAGIKPIQGVEVTVAGGYHLTLLAEDEEGYRNLCRILTKAHLDNPRRQPQAGLDILKEHAEGIIALSGCRKGEIPARILSRQYDAAYRAALAYLEIWGKDGFYLELQDTYLPGTRTLNRDLAELAEKLGVGVVATNNVHYACPEDFKVHDILTCVRTLTRVYEVHPERPLNAENHLKPEREMKKLFREYPQAVANTWEIAERCRPSLEPGASLFPRFNPPPGQTAESLLRELAYRGARKKYGRVTRRVEERLEHEIHIINTLGYADYFLVVWDIVEYARRQGIRHTGRGSVADSFVAYCLGITEVDSLARGLLFERFMSLERAEKPDIDIDFDARWRDRISEYVTRKYGEDKVAKVCTYSTYRARSAVRELGKALGLPEAELDRVAKRLPYGAYADRIRDMLSLLPELRESGLDRDKFALLLDLCERVAGFPRFLGTHLGGLVVSREPLCDITPLQQSAKGEIVTQFDKDDVEELGLVKLDLLSLRAMSAVEDTVRAVKQEKKTFDYEKIPLDDDATYRMINKGQTIGVFQLESPAQRALQARLGASDIEDIVASVALIRPGPIKGNMVEPYISRRQGREPVTFLHPALEPILAKTYGVILFQEQVIEIATAIARFTPGEADRLRKVMTHARSQKVMDEVGREFIKKAVENGVSQEAAATIFKAMAGYASYGFCEAHAAAFATTSYKTAYLLRHYPAQFYAAVLSNQPMGYYPPHVILNEARRRGIKILPPCINRSGEAFRVEKGGIRIPLARVKGLSREGLKKILVYRPFASLTEVWEKTGLARDEMKNLIKCGALDVFDTNRRRLLVKARKLYFRPQPAGNVKEGIIAFDDGEAADAKMDIPDFTEDEKYAMEFEILGLSPREHLMARFRGYLKRNGFKSSRDLAALPDGSWVKVAGVLLCPHRPPTKSGRITVFMSLEDEFGLTDVTVFEDVYQRYGGLIFSPQTSPLVVEGVLQKRGNAVSVVAKIIKRLVLDAD